KTLELPLQFDHHRLDAGPLLVTIAPQRDVGSGQLELGEEPLRHFRVVMLAGVEEQRREDIRARLLRREHGRHLHQIRAGSDDVDDTHHAALTEPTSLASAWLLPPRATTARARRYRGRRRPGAAAPGPPPPPPRSRGRRGRSDKRTG